MTASQDIPTYGSIDVRKSEISIERRNEEQVPSNKK
jgi:hypothetical protein